MQQKYMDLEDPFVLWNKIEGAIGKMRVMMTRSVAEAWEIFCRGKTDVCSYGLPVLVFAIV